MRNETIGCISPISHSLTRQGQASLAFQQIGELGAGTGAGEDGSGNCR